MTTKIVVLDLETEREERGPQAIGTLTAGRYSNEASPYSHVNTIVLGGTLTDGKHEYFRQEYRHSKLEDCFVVGHNLGFDIPWMMKTGCIDIKTISIWDTMIAEYYLTGQAS